jgi:hypothetical protein
MAIHSFTLMFLVGIAAPHSPAEEFARKEPDLQTVAAVERAASPREAQSPSIAGQVTDASGQRVPGVSVIALRDSGGVAARATTGSDGMYNIDALPGGGYRVDFDLASFDITRRNHVRVRAGATANVDAS